MIVITAIQAVLLFIIGFFVLYLAMLTVLALTQKEKTSFPASRTRKFAVVVPAHNEALVIESTLKSLLSLDYPEDRFEIVVVADNCNDETAALAAVPGVTVYERNDPHLCGKGYALRWCFDRLLNQQRGYEAVVVIDADSTVSNNFLTIMNHYLEAGARAIQCSDLADPESHGWSSEMIRLSFILYNFVRPHGRSVLGCSAGLKGNGMCFAVETLSVAPWTSFSLNEDLEYGLELLLKEIPIQFAPEAKLFAKMPNDANNAISQRARWETGRFSVIHKYSLKLLAAAISRKSFRLFDSFVEVVTPSFVGLIAGAVMMIVINLMLVLTGYENATMFSFLWLSVLLLGIFHVVAGLAAARVEVSVFWSLLHVPRYFIWKLKLYLGLVRLGQTPGWIRTTREVSSIGPK